MNLDPVDTSPDIAQRPSVLECVKGFIVFQKHALVGVLQVVGGESIPDRSESPGCFKASLSLQVGAL